MGIGNCYVVKENPEKAEKAYKRSLKIDDKFDYGLLRLAELYDSHHKQKKAVQYYRKYVETYPLAPDAGEIRAKIQRLTDSE